MVKLNVFYRYCLLQLGKRSINELVLLLILTDALITLMFSELLFPAHTSSPKFPTAGLAFFSLVIFAPLIETYVLQHGVLRYIIDKRPSSYLLACFISTILFAFLHHYSVPYILKTFISGWLYGSLYLIVFKKYELPFWVVAITHSIFNLIGFLIDWLPLMF